MKTCYYCGTVLRPPNKGKRGRRTPDDTATKDHWIPRCRGGANLMKVVCCVGCNQDKGQLTGDEFRVVMAFRKNAAVVKDIKIFAGEVWVPKPAYVSPPIPPPPPNIYGRLQAVVGAVVVAAILRLSVLRTLI